MKKINALIAALCAIILTTVIHVSLCVSVNADSDFEEFEVDGIVYYDSGFVGKQYGNVGPDVIIRQAVSHDNYTNGRLVPVDTFDYGAFEDQTGLKTIVLPISIGEVNNNAFSGCTSLEAVYYEGSEAQWNMIRIGEGNESLINAKKVFDYKKHLPEVPDVAVENDFLFINRGSYCEPIRYICTETKVKENVIIPEKVKFGALSLPVAIIDDLSFWRIYDVSGVTSITIPKTVKILDECVIDNGYTLKNLTTVYFTGSENEWNKIKKNGWDDTTYGDEPHEGIKLVFNNAAAAPGDRNGDGAIDNKDVVVLFRYVTSSNAEYVFEYDVNGDGCVDNKDVVALFRSLSSAAHIHSFSEWKITEPTCTEPGARERKCLTCGKTENEIIPAKDHEFIHGKSCVNCGKKLADTDNGYFTFNRISNGTFTEYEISAANPDDLPETVVIPDTYNGKPVTQIEEDGFAECCAKTVVLGENVRTVSDRAFEMSRSLERVVMPEGLVTIGETAFFECALKDADIPDSVFSIGAEAFEKCDIKELTVGKWIETAVYPVINWWGWSNSFTVKNIGLGNITKLTVKDNVSFIPGCAFAYCEKLESAVIGNGVTEIGEYAFDDCAKLKNVVFGDGVETICRHAFDGCGITELNLGKNVKNIGENAFKNCRGLKNIIVPEGVLSIDNGAFSSCWDIKTVSLPDSLVYFGTGVFTADGLKYNKYENCTYLGNENNPYVVLLETADKDLSSVKINERTRIICEGAFDGSAFRRVTIPDGVITIGSGAFRNCVNLTNVTIPDSVIYYGGYVFDGCEALKYFEADNGSYLGGPSNQYLILVSVNEGGENFTIGGNTRFIESEAFAFCNIKEIVIPASVDYIGGEAFRECRELETVKIENSEISADMFSGCGRLADVTVSAGVSSIGAYAFSDCGSLEEITYEGTLDQWKSVEKDNNWWPHWTEKTVHGTDADLIF